jgi:hypothetical protein
MSVSKLEIQLERASGVYYAGEVVRGTVALETSGSKEVTCRGFRVRLQGRARVHWHTGSGDNRHDYDGSTLFQSQRHTLAGNFHRTALLDEAGEDADFEIVPYSGVMRIPCQGHEEQNLKLIVRVMDYDFGKRDDLLGEIVLDVPSLAQARQQQSFPLTRKGKPEKGEVTLSAKWLPFDAVFPTASRSGERVSMTQSMVLELTVHKATGLRKADWVGKNDVYCQVYRIPNGTTLNLSKALPVPSKEMKLPAGRTVYPFAFALRSDAPGSAELNVWDYAHVRCAYPYNNEFCSTTYRKTFLILKHSHMYRRRLRQCGQGLLARSQSQGHLDGHSESTRPITAPLDTCAADPQGPGPSRHGSMLLQVWQD